jgi:hypothetical protein
MWLLVIRKKYPEANQGSLIYPGINACKSVILVYLMV